MADYKQTLTLNDLVPIDVSEINLEGVDVTNLGDLSIQGNKTFQLNHGGSPLDNAFLKYNTALSRLELWVNGALAASW